MFYKSVNHLFVFNKLSVLLFLLGGFLLGVPTCYSQTLSKLSLTKRSDGKGYVLRFHLDSAIDSLKLLQPSPNLLQIATYSKNLQLGSPSHFELLKPVKSVIYVPIESGYGFNIELETESFFITNFYPDANKRDWLVALTFASENDVNVLTQGLSPIDWTTTIIADTTKTDEEYTDIETIVESDTTKEGIEFDFTSLALDANYNKIKDKTKFDRIVIDAGHGGKDSGTLGFKKTKEKDIALSVALKLGALIEKNLPEVKVIYTRKDDRFIDLEDRGHFANQVEGDLFISIHCNAAANRNATGTEVFFLGQHHSDDALQIMSQENSVIRLESGENKITELTADQLIIYELTNSGYMSDAQVISEMIDTEFKGKKRKSRGVKQAGFVVLYYASMPAILVELGFISNKGEEQFLVSKRGQNVMAESIFKAIIEYKNRADKN